MNITCYDVVVWILIRGYLQVPVKLPKTAGIPRPVRTETLCDQLHSRADSVRSPSASASPQDNMGKGSPPPSLMPSYVDPYQSQFTALLPVLAKSNHRHQKLKRRRRKRPPRAVPRSVFYTTVGEQLRDLDLDNEANFLQVCQCDDTTWRQTTNVSSVLYLILRVQSGLVSPMPCYSSPRMNQLDQAQFTLKLPC